MIETTAKTPSLKLLLSKFSDQEPKRSAYLEEVARRAESVSSLQDFAEGLTAREV